MKKFYELVNEFSVGLQSNIPQGEEAEGYLKEGVGKNDIFFNPERGQIFHPADAKFNGDDMEITFRVVTNSREKFKKLVFFSKVRAVAARFGESEPFGFDALQPGPNYRGCGYLLLAFPGITGGFAPTYFKITPRGKKPFYLAVEADGDENKIVVRAKTVMCRDCPHHLM